MNVDDGRKQAVPGEKADFTSLRYGVVDSGWALVEALKAMSDSVAALSSCLDEMDELSPEPKNDEARHERFLTVHDIEVLRVALVEPLNTVWEDLGALGNHPILLAIVPREEGQP